MDYYIFQESSKWREWRDKRVISFLRISGYIMVVGGIAWSVVGLLEHLYLITLFSALMAVVSLYALYRLHHNSVVTAKNLLFLFATFYFLVVCIFLDGPDGTNQEQGAAYFWFIVLAIFFYFGYYDTNPWIRDSISVLFFALFFLFHFQYISFTPLIHIEQRDMINKVTMISALLTTYIITRQFAVQIANDSKALADSADRLQGLVENILPKSIAERLTKEKRSFADSFSECSVLFADIAGFTGWAERHTAAEVAERLNSIFSDFDEAVDKMNLTKIKTSGDSYMVVSGLPESRVDHAGDLIKLALEFLEIASNFSDLKFRIGINSGPVAAGVIGKKRFIYDLWGDTVNIASRMESSGEVGKVNISGATYELVKDKFNCTYRGKVKAKNKGEVDMYFADLLPQSVRSNPAKIEA